MNYSWGGVRCETGTKFWPGVDRRFHVDGYTVSWHGDSTSMQLVAIALHQLWIFGDVAMTYLLSFNDGSRLAQPVHDRSSNISLVLNAFYINDVHAPLIQVPESREQTMRNVLRLLTQ